MSTTRLTLDLFTPNDDARPVWLTGNFNDWKVRDERFLMTRKSAGHYEFTFKRKPTLDEPLEYKYTKGGWESEELNDESQPTHNRRLETWAGKVFDV